MQFLFQDVLAQSSGMEWGKKSGSKHAGSKFYVAVLLVLIRPFGTEVVIIRIPTC